MRRLAFFVLLGRFLIWFIFVAIALAHSDRLMLEERRYFPASLLACYAIAPLPQLVIAHTDHRLSRNRWRVLVCFLVGFGMAVALFYSLAEGGGEKEFRQYWFFLGLMVGLPAAVCSWLSGRYATDG